MTSERLNWRVVVVILFCMTVVMPISSANAQTPNGFDVRLDQIDWMTERTLNGPMSNVHYYFSLPANWDPVAGGYLELDMDYKISRAENYPPAFLTIFINKNRVYLDVLETPGPRKIRVNIPPNTLELSEGQNSYDLMLQFEVGETCEKALLISLIVRGSSFLHLAYQEKPLPIDLSDYPKPFYQALSLKQEALHFVLPSEPSDADLNAAVRIAARLGQLTASRLPIKASLSSDLEVDNMPEENLILIGTPDSQTLLQALDLPVNFKERRLALYSEMPAVSKAGDSISYIITVENLSGRPYSLMVEDQIPVGGKLLSCSGQCTESAPGTVQWQVGLLGPEEQASITLEVQLNEWSPPDNMIEHTASLFDDQGNVLNVDTLSAQVGAETSDEKISSQADSIRYFFTHENQAIPEGDGLVQEIISPWSASHGIIAVTGLDQNAILKAAEVLSAREMFPGVKGNYAIVKATHTLNETVSAPVERMSFASLGYRDQSINQIDQTEIEYSFDLPLGWVLDEDAYMALHFTHGVALNDLQATLEAELNGLSIGSVHLDDSNSYGSWVALPLPATATQVGTNLIRLRIGVDADLLCKYLLSDRYWLTIFSDSFFHLRSRTVDKYVDLDDLPYPFGSRPDLADLAFLLSENPKGAEIEGALRLASRFGNSGITSQFLLPQAVLGGQPDETPWAGYNLVVVGLHTDNSYLRAANPELPQPFYPGTNRILQPDDQTVYRMGTDMSLGYIELLPSPWDGARKMMAVTGTNVEGVTWALNALSDEKLEDQVGGNITLVHDRDVRSMDTTKEIVEDIEMITQSMVPGMSIDIMPVFMITTTVSTSPTETVQ